jgi:hypothetical protein
MLEVPNERWNVSLICLAGLTLDVLRIGFVVNSSQAAGSRDQLLHQLRPFPKLLYQLQGDLFR